MSYREKNIYLKPDELDKKNRARNAIKLTNLNVRTVNHMLKVHYPHSVLQPAHV